MLLSLCYVVVRWILRLGALRVRSTDLKELEIVVLRHELSAARNCCGVQEIVRLISRLHMHQMRPTKS